mmetsp:Transcript_74356/g.174528  ORF Transcript_74356/g.174528 Transcript_74356/m.174528 type:complete len:130 (+) Transcript_74356:8-397(+)
MTKKGGSKTITKAELAKHDSQENCWIQIKGKVYDVSKFLADHPGGDAVLLEYAGQDATQAFDDIGHSGDAVQQLDDFLVGDVEGGYAAPAKSGSSGGSAGAGGNNTSLFLLLAVLVVGLAFFAQKNGMF